MVGALVRGPEGIAEPQEFRLTDGICRIGSGPGNDIELRDRTVSRNHAELSLGPGGVVVRDLGSTNGTFYLDHRIGEAVLALGTSVRFGAITMRLEPDTEGLLAELEYAETSYRGVLGTSVRMRTLFALLRRLESSLATVLIEGESGAGKEGIASAIHSGSPVASGRLVVLNCGAVSRELIASELFGHKRGAFTGAIDNRKGAFEAADGGTLFLDEIGELPLDVQPALLRALEASEIKPVGSDEVRKVRVRVLAATHRDLEAEVAQGRFRQDLFYRLAVVRVQIPPLRARPEDIPQLAEHFAQKLGLPSVPRAVMDELRARQWPGNARELRNALEAYAAVGQLPPAAAAAALLDAESFFKAIVDPARPYGEAKEEMVEDFTRAYIKALLAYTNGNQAAAARVARMDRTYLGRLIAKYGLNVRRFE